MGVTAAATVGGDGASDVDEPVPDLMAEAALGRPPLQTVDRACSVLLAFTEQDEWGVGELAAHAGWEKSGTSRLLTTLSQRGLLMVNPVSHRYRLGLAVLLLAQAAGQGNTLARFVAPTLEHLATLTGETVLFLIPDGSQGTCLMSRYGTGRLRYTSVPGSKTPGHAGAGARVMFAYYEEERRRALFGRRPLERFTSTTATDYQQLEDLFEQTRREGYAVSHGEVDDHVCSVASAVRLHRTVIGAIAVVAPDARIRPHLEHIVELVGKAAADIASAAER